MRLLHKHAKEEMEPSFLPSLNSVIPGLRDTESCHLFWWKSFEFLFYKLDSLKRAETLSKLSFWFREYFNVLIQ